MNLAFILHHYFPYGGLQNDFLRIANTCAKRGHKIHVYTMNWEGTLPPHFQLHIVKPHGWQNHTRSKHFIRQITPQLSQHDFIVGFNKMPNLDVYYAADVCLKARMENSKLFLSRFLPRYRHLLSCEKATFAPDTLTEILLISPQEQANFERCWETPLSRFHLLPPGIRLDRLAPANAVEIRQQCRSQFKLTPQQKVVLFIGSGFKTKGLDRAIYALAELPKPLQRQTQLWVIGDDHATSFKRQAEQLGMEAQVHFLGGRHDIPNLLLLADLLLHPAYHENTGTVLLEALAAGLPVLTTERCGYAHYVQEANGGMVLPLPFQQAKLNAALTLMLSCSTTHWQEQALKFAKSADIYSMPERAADIIETLAKKKRSFTNYMNLTGECYREQKGRRTHRVCVDQNSYFIKQFFGVGWREIFKNLLQLRLPIISAENEWQALQKLATLSIAAPRVKACGKQGKNPARMQSFVMMEEITNAMSLEELMNEKKITFPLKHQLIREVAHIARTLHENGMNHRDFYLCHFLLSRNSPKHQLYLIDLHRAQIRARTPRRWRIKDLAGLYFSSLPANLSARDYWRFIRYYRGKPLQDLISEKKFWLTVKKRGEKLAREHKQ